jgi:hypothetical protein
VSNSKYQVFDNFLDDPDEVLEYANTCQYFTAEEYQKIDPLESVGNWPGLRSNDLQLEFPDITHKLNKMFNVRVGWLTFYQHLVSQNIGKPTPHTDVRWDFSGVIYLKGSDGTWIDNEIVPFKYNRAVCFDADTPHHPLYGSSDRLVLTFFSKYAT